LEQRVRASGAYLVLKFNDNEAKPIYLDISISSVGCAFAIHIRTTCFNAVLSQNFDELVYAFAFVAKNIGHISQAMRE
jgi:hypothetical protein